MKFVLPSMIAGVLASKEIFLKNQYDFYQGIRD
jgi:hypothetical protein